MKKVTNIKLIELMPESLRKDPKIQAICSALDSELNKINNLTKEIVLLPRLNYLPESVLDLLAWQWHVDFYEPVGLDIETKRELIRKSIAAHRIKGTPAAVEYLFKNVFNGGKITEWYEYDGQPYHFKISAVGKQIASEQQLLEFKNALESTKNVRSWLDGFEVSLYSLFEWFLSSIAFNLIRINKKIFIENEYNKSDIFNAFIQTLVQNEKIKPIIQINSPFLNKNLAFTNYFSSKIEYPSDPEYIIQHDLTSTALLDLLLVGSGIVRDGNFQPFINYIFKNNTNKINVTNLFGINSRYYFNSFTNLNNKISISKSGLINKTISRHDSSSFDFSNYINFDIHALIIQELIQYISDLDNVIEPSTKRIFRNNFELNMNSFAFQSVYNKIPIPINSNALFANFSNNAIISISRVINLFSDDSITFKPIIIKFLLAKIHEFLSECIAVFNYLKPDFSYNNSLIINSNNVTQININRFNRNILPTYFFPAKYFIFPIFSQLFFTIHKEKNSDFNLYFNNFFNTNYNFATIEHKRIKSRQIDLNQSNFIVPIILNTFYNQSVHFYIFSDDFSPNEREVYITKTFSNNISELAFLNSSIIFDNIIESFSTDYSISYVNIPTVSIYQHYLNDLILDPHSNYFSLINYFSIKTDFSSLKHIIINSRNFFNYFLDYPIFLNAKYLISERINVNNYVNHFHNSFYLNNAVIPSISCIFKYELNKEKTNVTIEKTIDLIHYFLGTNSKFIKFHTVLNEKSNTTNLIADFPSINSYYFKIKTEYDLNHDDNNFEFNSYFNIFNNFTSLFSSNSLIFSLSNTSSKLMFTKHCAIINHKTIIFNKHAPLNNYEKRSK